MANSAQGTVRMSVVIPSRERAAYILHALKTCLATPETSVEFIVLDNASTDGTRAIVSGIADPRIRYESSDTRLSMRDNFERGLDLARGEFICFIGDDDAILPQAVGTALSLFDEGADAVSCERAHYFWPDLLASRRDSILIPRGLGVEQRNSRTQLRTLLRDSNYYTLPCVYHGFVRRTVIERIRQRQSRLFLSSQVDMFSAISLSMENLTYAHSFAPLIVNGGSARSNGASHFSGGSNVEKENWKKEDEVGFLPGFENFATVGSLIVESALRYCRARGDVTLVDLFEPGSVERALRAEYAERERLGRSTEGKQLVFAAANLNIDESIVSEAGAGIVARLGRMADSYRRICPLDAKHRGIADVAGATSFIANRVERRKTGLTDNPLEQLRVAVRIAFGRAPTTT